MDGGVDVEVNLEIPLEPSVLAAFGLDAEIPTHIPMSVSIQYQNQDQDQERISNRTQDPAAHPSCHDDLLVSDLRTVTSSSSTAFTDSTPTAHTATSYNESLASKLPMSSCDAPGEEVFSAYTMLPPPTEEAGNNVALLHVYRSLFYLPKLSFGSLSLTSRSETRPLLFVNLMESMLTRARFLFNHMASVKSTPLQ